MTTAREALAKVTSEDQLLQAITDAATLYGWRWTHTRRSDRALTMGHLGFPDLVLARRGQVVFLELKTERGVVTADQQAWKDAINDHAPVGIHDAFVIRPMDLDMVLDMLR